MRLKPEGGVTEISLSNAKEIIREYGLPSLVQLINKAEDTSGHVVHVTWGDPEADDAFEHEFDGFSWGYGGEGPAGLVKFLEMTGVVPERLVSSVVGILPASTKGLILALARNRWAVEFAHDSVIEKNHPSIQRDNVEGPVKNLKLR